MLELLVQEMPRAAPSKRKLNSDLARLGTGRDVSLSQYSKSGSELYFSPRLASHDRATLLLSGEYAADDVVAAHSFLEQATVEFGVEFAFLHCPVDRDRQAGLNYFSLLDQVALLDLKRRGLQFLYWSTVFGPTYIELFGREALLSAPAHRVDALTDEGILIQLSPDSLDSRNDWPTIQRVRSAVIQHLGAEYFLDPTNVDRRCELPSFGTS